MANPVGGHTNPPPPNPDQPPRGSIWERIGFFVKEIFSRFPQAEPSPLPYQASAGGVRSLKEGILTQWLESQPENAKAEAQQIVSMLLQKNLENLFELNIQNYHNITSFPNVLQNCTKLKCISCTSLQMLPELPVCTELFCFNCTSLQALPELSACTKLVCPYCPSLQMLPELPACLDLNCDGCISLQTLPALPACTNLVCSSCTSLVALPELPICETLDCRTCTSLQALPELPDCVELLCSDCTSLQALPELPACTMLDCSNCLRLQALPELPVCTELNCFDCTNLQALPELPVCTKLICHNCTSLQALPELPVCITLYCRECTSLETLPELKICTTLNCDNCTSLQALPELPVCVWLTCSACTSLRALPELPRCVGLICRGCISLQTLPLELPVCRTLDCSDCTSLQALPELPRCETLTCSNCPRLQALPELRNCHTLNCENCPLLRNIPPHLNRQYMIPRDIGAQADVHYGNRDSRTKDALILLWQTRLNADQINRQFGDFIRYFDGLAHSEKKAQANLALREPKRDQENFGPLLDNIPFSIHGFKLEGKELIARLWNFISSLDLNEQPLAKEGIVTALSDSFAPSGGRVCNQGKTQRLCISVLQGRLNGVQIDDIEIPNPDLATSLNLFFASQERQEMEPQQLREQARLFCDQNPLVAREEFLAQVEEIIRLRE